MKLNAKKLPICLSDVKNQTIRLNVLLCTAWVFFCLSACSQNTQRAPISSVAQPNAATISHHIVAKGDTLYAIAWRYNLNYKDLSRINKIYAPFAIKPGQVIKLHGVAHRSAATTTPRTSTPRTTTPRKSTNAPSLSSANISQSAPATRASRNASTIPRSNPKAPKAKAPKPPPPSKKRSVKRTAKPVDVKSPAVKSSPLVWSWPLIGEIVSAFSTSKGLNKGIDIAAKLGESVRAAADGYVVYAGSGLRGYGNLIIVKHQKSYLSAYAHNSKLLAKEGDAVKKGEKIAVVGSSGTSKVKLHFEIRRDGVPVDPIKYLPR